MINLLSNPSFLSMSFLPSFVLVAVWTLVWKGWALWRAGRKNSKVWFIALLLINTLGLLEILYIFFFSKMDKKNETSRN